jgi:hypothetical protein
MSKTMGDTTDNEPPDPTVCWCCGRASGERTAGFVQLDRHSEVRICFDCLDWLNQARLRKVEAVERHWRAVKRYNHPSLAKRLCNIYPGKRCGQPVR